LLSSSIKHLNLSSQYSVNQTFLKLLVGVKLVK
jgi:hypothetical protein